MFQMANERPTRSYPMRFFATAIAFLCFQTSLLADAPAGSSSPADWQRLGVASVEILPGSSPFVFDPAQSLEQNNQRNASNDPAQSPRARVTVPASQLRLTQIVDRKVRLNHEEQNFNGRVVSVALSVDSNQVRQATLFVQIDNTRTEGQWNLAHGSKGVLSIQE